MKYTINMLSKAHTVKGQGVSSAHDEQVSLVKNGLFEKFEVSENKFFFADITHYHTINPQYYMSIPFVKMSGGVAVGYVHFLPETVETSLNIIKPAKKFFYKYLISFYKSMDYLVTVNPYFIDKLVEHGIDRDKIVYIPNFVCDQTFFPVNSDKKMAWRRKYELDEDKFTVVCAGQLQKRKGVMDFIQCAWDLPHIQFVWAGGFSFGHMTDGYEEINNALKNPPPNLKLTGIIDRKYMNEIYNLGDVMFLPSFDELFPMTILESMNCNLPILLRDIPIYENILFDYYLKEKDVEGFKKCILKLESDKNFYQDACEHSWKGHQFYNKKHVLAMWDKFYSNLQPKSFVAKVKEKMRISI